MWHTGDTKEPLAYIPLLHRRSCPIWGISGRKYSLSGARYSAHPIFLIALQLGFGPFRNGTAANDGHEKSPVFRDGLFRAGAAMCGKRREAERSEKQLIAPVC